MQPNECPSIEGLRGGDAVRIEHGIHVAECREQRTKRFHVADLAAEGADLELLEGIAALIPEHCLVAWDTGGVPWEES